MGSLLNVVPMQMMLETEDAVANPELGFQVNPQTPKTLCAEFSTCPQIDHRHLLKVQLDHEMNCKHAKRFKE
jgi:hypothetical protein